MSNIIKIVCFTICITVLFFEKTYSQKCDQESGQYYSIDIFTVLKNENSRPVVLNCITKAPEKIAISKKSLAKFVCSIFQTCYYLNDSEMELIENIKKCDIGISKRALTSAINDYEIKNKALNKASITYNLVLLDSTKITVKIKKFKGDVWLFNADSISLNNHSSQITGPINCYIKKKYYALKKIYRVVKIDNIEEKRILQTW